LISPFHFRTSAEDIPLSDFSSHSATEIRAVA